ncbi:MAG TPA: LacI family DNA-binding transcriptional regulator [Thermomicrobiales bacterium]|jgi:DNA-binding LacI/PurR family transcriptional regulator
MAETVGKRVTMAEVARAAGVSVATVSLVLNGRDRDLQISETTAIAVLEAAARLDYTPNHAARSLRRRRTNTFTILIFALDNPYYADIARAARQAAAAHGYKLHIVETLGPDAEMDALRNLQSGDSDGVIVATIRHGALPHASEAFREVVRRGLAAVTLLDYSADPRIPAIRIDDEADAYLATAHLITLGHRRIAYLNNSTATELAQGQPGHAFDRYRGYRRALGDAGIPFDPACVFAGHWSPAGGRAMVRELLARAEPRPTALFCFNDLIAIGALRGLYEAGVRVPGEMAVLGFDGIEPGAFTTPALSTVAHSREDLGRLGVETLLGLLDGRAPDKPDHVLPGRLLLRESCGTPSAFRLGGGAP